MQNLLKNGTFQKTMIGLIGTVLGAAIAVGVWVGTTSANTEFNKETRTIVDLNTVRVSKIETLMTELQKGQERIETKLDKLYYK